MLILHIMENQTIIKLKEVSKNYSLGKTTITALKSVSFTIHKKDFLVFAGASGSGKTTLLNIIGLIDKPTAGDVWLDGKTIDLTGGGKLTPI